LYEILGKYYGILISCTSKLAQRKYSKYYFKIRDFNIICVSKGIFSYLNLLFRFLILFVPKLLMYLSDILKELIKIVFLLFCVRVLGKFKICLHQKLELFRISSSLLLCFANVRAWEKENELLS